MFGAKPAGVKLRLTRCPCPGAILCPGIRPRKDQGLLDPQCHPRLLPFVAMLREQQN